MIDRQIPTSRSLEEKTEEGNGVFFFFFLISYFFKQYFFNNSLHAYCNPTGRILILLFTTKLPDLQ